MSESPAETLARLREVAPPFVVIDLPQDVREFIAFAWEHAEHIAGEHTALRDLINRLNGVLQEHKEACCALRAEVRNYETFISAASSVAAVFQPGGEFHAEVMPEMWGRSTAIEGMTWLIQQVRALRALLRELVQRHEVHDPGCAAWDLRPDSTAGYTHMSAPCTWQPSGEPCDCRLARALEGK